MNGLLREAVALPFVTWHGQPPAAASHIYSLKDLELIRLDASVGLSVKIRLITARWFRGLNKIMDNGPTYLAEEGQHSL